MRREIIVLGFSLIVLMLIAGCTSTQIASPESKRQTPTPGYTTVKTTSMSSQSSLPECNLPSPDPIQFQKFLPNVPGYTSENRTIKQKDYKSLTYNEMVGRYQISDRSNINLVQVFFVDKGPCVNDSTGNYAFLNNYELGDYSGGGGEFRSKINDFHGYPAIRTTFNGSFVRNWVFITINNRLSILIHAEGPTFGNSNYSLSQAEQDIEKFANAIDFKGFAASV